MFKGHEEGGVEKREKGVFRKEEEILRSQDKR